MPVYYYQVMIAWVATVFGVNSTCKAKNSTVKPCLSEQYGTKGCPLNNAGIFKCAAYSSILCKIKSFIMIKIFLYFR